MLYKVGAEQLERVPAMAYRPVGCTGHPGLLRSALPTRWMLARAVPPVASQPRSSKSLTRTGKLHSSTSAPAVSWPFLPAPKCRFLALS
jgi:hypothetical protein